MKQGILQQSGSHISEILTIEDNKALHFSGKVNKALATGFFIIQPIQVTQEYDIDGVSYTTFVAIMAKF